MNKKHENFVFSNFPMISHYFQVFLTVFQFSNVFISFQKMHGWEGPSRSKITKILEKLENRVFSCFSLWFPIILQFSSGFSNFPMFFFTLFRTCTAGRIRAVAKSPKYMNKNKNLVFSFFFADFQLFCIFFRVFQLFDAFNTFQKMHSWEDPSLPSIFWKVFKNIWKLENTKGKLKNNWKSPDKIENTRFSFLFNMLVILPRLGSSQPCIFWKVFKTFEHLKTLRKIWK